MNKAMTMLVVTDLEISKQFYVNVMGLKIRAERPNQIHFMLGDHEIVMFQGDGPAIKSKHAYDANSTLLFTTTQLDEKISQLKAHGVEFVHQTPYQQAWGRYAAFKDPSGIVHELFELGEDW